MSCVHGQVSEEQASPCPLLSHRPASPSAASQLVASLCILTGPTLWTLKNRIPLCPRTP